MQLIAAVQRAIRSFFSNHILHRQTSLFQPLDTFQELSLFGSELFYSEALSIELVL